MKRDITIVVPHPDDEFIWCRKLIKDYRDRIKSVIFFSNGETQIGQYIDLIDYVETRRKESYSWLHFIDPEIKLYFLNFPDVLLGSKIFEPDHFYCQAFKKRVGCSPIDHIKDQLKQLISTDILVYPGESSHIVHWYCWYVCRDIVHENKMPHVKYLTRKKPNSLASKEFRNCVNWSRYQDFYQYSYRYPNRKKQRNKEFEKYYYSQAMSFVTSEYKMPMTESYWTTKGTNIFNRKNDEN